MCWRIHHRVQAAGEKLFTACAVTAMRGAMRTGLRRTAVTIQSAASSADKPATRRRPGRGDHRRLDQGVEQRRRMHALVAPIRSRPRGSRRSAPPRALYTANSGDDLVEHTPRRDVHDVPVAAFPHACPKPRISRSGGNSSTPSSARRRATGPAIRPSGRRIDRPALLTRTSTPPNSSSTWATRRRRRRGRTGRRRSRSPRHRPPRPVRRRSRADPSCGPRRSPARPRRRASALRPHRYPTRRGDQDPLPCRSTSCRGPNNWAANGGRMLASSSVSARRRSGFLLTR